MDNENVPNVDICMPVRNRAKILPSVLKALYMLDYPKNKLRLIFIDDESADETPSILKDFYREHANEYDEIIIERVTHLSFNIPRVRNLALRHVKSDLIFWLDSDVIPQPDALKVLIYELMSSNNNIASCIPYAYKKEDLEKTLLPIDVDFSLGCTLIRKDFLRKIGGFDERYSRTDDLWLSQLIKKSGLKIKIHKGERCLHLSPLKYHKVLLSKFTGQSKSLFLLMTDGLWDFSLYRRHLYYSALLLSLIFSFLFPSVFLVISLILIIIGVIWHKSLIRFAFIAPIGLLTTLGIFFALLNPKVWKLIKIGPIKDHAPKWDMGE
jgi:glycosyltransferase involved in cell wall biosynthesis